MKKLLLMLCLATTNAFGEKKTTDTEIVSSTTDCTVTLKTISCTIRKATECYEAKCPLEAATYQVYIIPWTYGVSGNGYTIHYARNHDGILIMGHSYETKSEAISAWINKVYGEGCNYVFK